jgi:hypothetical protein
VLLFALAGTLGATIIYNTNSPGTGFSSGASLTLNNTGGQAATLTFIPDANITTGVPSFINLGNFTLVCAGCTPTVSTSFAPFTFDLVITDLTDAASGKFVGTSTGGLAFSDASTLSVNWAPLQLGPHANNALTGDFGSTVFTTTLFTAIVAPNSGEVHGQSTVQGHIDAVPEPATFGLLGGSLLVLGLLGRKKFSRR